MFTYASPTQAERAQHGTGGAGISTRVLDGVRQKGLHPVPPFFRPFPTHDRGNSTMRIPSSFPL